MDVTVNGTGASSGYDRDSDSDSHRPAGTGKYTEYTADIAVLCYVLMCVAAAPAVRRYSTAS